MTKHVFILLFFSSLTGFWPEFIHGQECSGNFGENIFTEGDFGSGMQNIPSLDPGFAPGYTYTTSPPPDDGFYTLTNNMAAWSNTFPAWIAVQDNSSDGFGYMMVVNASFSPGIFYEQIVDDLCENTVYEFSADVINLIQREVTNHIRPNLSFLIDDTEIFSTGAVAQDELWHTYPVSFSTLPGQTSVKLTLRNNAPGGIGNDLALDNIRFRPCGPAAATLNTMPGRICENALIFPELTAVVDGVSIDTAIQWQMSTNGGLTWTDIPGANDLTHAVQQLAAGSYEFRYLWATSKSSLNNSKCRIISDPITVEVVPIEYLIRDTICRGLSYDLGGTLYSETGVYNENLISSIGCDSIVTLELTIWDPPPSEIQLETTNPTCAGYADGTLSLSTYTGFVEPVLWEFDGLSHNPEETVETEAGSYIIIVTDYFGCTASESVQIIDPPIFELSEIPDTTVRLGSTFLPSPTANLPLASVYWFPFTDLSCNPCTDPEILPLETTVYSAVGESDKGCIDSVQFQITVKAETRIFLPNVFSPNQDGINDVWMPIADMLNISRIKSLIIGDRWGAIVLEVKNAAPGDPGLSWDGTYKGELSNSGVYTYFIEVVRIDGREESMAGTITLIR